MFGLLTHPAHPRVLHQRNVRYSFLAMVSPVWFVWCCIRYFRCCTMASSTKCASVPHVDVIPSISLVRVFLFGFLSKGNRWARCDQTKKHLKTKEKTTRQKRMREISSPSAAFSSSLFKFWLYRNADMERKKQKKHERVNHQRATIVLMWRIFVESFSSLVHLLRTPPAVSRHEPAATARVSMTREQRLGAHDDPSGHHHLPSSSRSFTRQVHIAVQSREK